MHLHISRARRNGKTYEYAQLMQSYRRSDGMPTQRVVAKLGRLSAHEVANLRAALDASRRGQRVVLSGQQLGSALTVIKPTENLRYLDLAVLCQQWRQLGIDQLLSKLLPIGDAEIAPADVVTALTLQRCVDPGSKLYAERWFPRTALPELLGIRLRQFNNTRIHRVLDQLDAVTHRLMHKLPSLYGDTPEGSTAYFLDVTDTWFVGMGPQSAKCSKTKEGFFKQKVGIVLLCNERGLPMRWEVVEGTTADAPAMHAMLHQVKGLSWIAGAPVVCDRSMGTRSEVTKLLRTGLRFLTALKVTEYGSFSDSEPFRWVANFDVDPQLSIEARQQLIGQLSEGAQTAGMQQVSSTLYVRDLGVVSSDDLTSTKAKGQRDTDPLMRALRMAREIDTMVSTGHADTFLQAARRLGISREGWRWYRKLLRLTPDLQHRILDGQVIGLSITQATKLARIPDADQQQKEFERVIASLGSQKRRTLPLPDTADSMPVPDHVELKMRAIVTFNPERFVDQQRHAQEKLNEVQAFVKEMNRKLTLPSSQRTPRQIELDMDRMLRDKGLLEVYRTTIQTTTHKESRRTYQVTAELDVTKWAKRRRYDGFSMLVAHADLPHSAVELAELYRAKDAVEKDFQTIKSLIKLRPIWHRTDAKVRAHVTLCMLALIMERVLSERLQMSFALAVETLSTCDLNRLKASSGPSTYITTEPDSEQRAILRKLRLEHLVDDDDVASAITPR